MRGGVKSQSPRARVAAGAGVVLVLVGVGVAWLRGDGGVPDTQRLGDVTVERRWSLELPDPGDSDPDTPQVVVDGGWVFVGQYEQVQAFDLATGEERWNVDTGGRVRGLGAADGVVAARLSETGDDELALFDRASGERRWDGVSIVADESDPVVADGVVLLRGIIESGGLEAIDIATGRRRWNQPAAAGVPCWTGSAAVTLWYDDPGPGTDPTPELAALSLEDGEPLAGPATTESATEVACSPGAVTVSSDTVAAMHDVDTLDAIATIEDNVSGLGIMGETTVISVDGDGHQTLVAYDTTTGDELWRHPTAAAPFYDRVQYQQVGDGIVVTSHTDGDNRGDRRFTQLLDGDGRLLGDIEEGVDDPWVLETAPDGGSMFVIGDGEQLVGLELTA